jgi:hypothetical protein
MISRHETAHSQACQSCRRRLFVEAHCSNFPLRLVCRWRAGRLQPKTDYILIIDSKTDRLSYAAEAIINYVRQLTFGITLKSDATCG